MDSAGNVYVVDSFNHRIQKFGPDGSFLLKWGTMGNRDGEFQFPQEIASDNAGNIYVVETSKNRMQLFDTKGRFLSSLTIPMRTFTDLEGIVV